MKIDDTREYFYQWDSGQRIILESYPAGVEVHFTLTPRTAYDALRCKTALVVKSYEENGKVYADVPNRLLQVAGKLIAYVYMENATRGQTMLCNAFPIIARPRPADYVFTEQEIMRWDALDERITKLEKASEVGGFVPVYTGEAEVI